jgi:hypothetical protein
VAKQDLRLDLGFYGHGKTRRLIRRLGDAGVIALQKLWIYAAINHPGDGILPMDAESIADVCDWHGDSIELVSALTEGLQPGKSGFLEELPDGRGFRLHDWEDHQEYLVHAPDRTAAAKNAANARWAKRAKLGKDAKGMPGACGAHQEGNAPDPTPTPTPDPDPDPKPKKKHYAEYVMLTEDEHGKLVAGVGPEMTARCIEILDNYKGSTGKRYKSDYRTILNWVISRAQEEKAKGIAPVTKPRKEIRLENVCDCRAGLREVRENGVLVALVCQRCGRHHVRYE